MLLAYLGIGSGDNLFGSVMETFNYTALYWLCMLCAIKETLAYVGQFTIDAGVEAALGFMCTAVPRKTILFSLSDSMVNWMDGWLPAV